MPIEQSYNRPCFDDARISVSLVGPGGSAGHLLLSPDQLADYNSDPDRYAAGYLGVSIRDYREWVRLEGTALCGAKTRKGLNCRCNLGGIQRTLKDWRRVHRNFYCSIHGGNREFD